jgi:hypothetical protein
MQLPLLSNSSLMMSKWKSVLDVLLGKPLSNSSILVGIQLKSGANVINHLLDRDLQGWIIVRQDALASIYDTQDLNQTPQLTLQLTSSAKTVVDILVF